MNLEKITTYVIYYIFDYLPSEDVVRYAMTSHNTFYRLFDNTAVVEQNLLEYTEHYKRNKRYYEKMDERMTRLNLLDPEYMKMGRWMENGARPIANRVVKDVEAFSYQHSFDTLHNIVKHDKDKRFCNFIYHNKWRPRNHDKWRLKTEHKEDAGFLTFNEIIDTSEYKTTIPMFDIYRKTTVSLKELLWQQKLPITGKKADLIERIIQHNKRVKEEGPLYHLC